MIRLIALLLALSGPALGQIAPGQTASGQTAPGQSASGQSVRVTSGEHGDFTRLVLQFPAAVDWTVSRTPDGYQLRVAQGSPRYDLSRAFDLIGRQRIAALDQQQGRLAMTVPCACHALPFALRPDTVVIDIHDGPPPAAWAFEDGPDGTALPPLGPGLGPPPALWDWRSAALAQAGTPAPVAPKVPFAPPPLPPEMADSRLVALRLALTDSFARAATRDLIDPVEKMKPPKGPLPDMPEMAHVQIGPGLQAYPGPIPPGDLAADGALCPGEERLALQDWGDDRPISEQMADATASLSGEFDRTQPEAALRAIRFQLFLGFGAEARALLRAFGSDLPDAALWQTMARVVDGAADPDGAFRGLAGCDDPAALWATLADPALPVSDANRRALLRSFSALPVHLRTQLGPPLAERFLIAGDATGARALSDAVLRPVPGDDQRRTALMQARFAIDQGDLAAADRILAKLIADPGPVLPQLLALQVDLAALQETPVPPTTITALAGLLREAPAEDAPQLQRALVLGQALSGDFAAAFAQLPQAPDSAADLWRLLANKGQDADLIAQAVAADPVVTAGLAAPTRHHMAERLLQLGFAEAAEAWAGPDAPLITAQAALLLGQPLRVQQLLGPDNGAEARRLKAEALLQTDAKAAMGAFSALGDAEAEARAARLAGAWPELAKDGPAPWQDLAKNLDPPPLPQTALAESRALAQASIQTRDAVAALLAAVPPPEAQ